MMSIHRLIPHDFRPAARGALAAAGPVEPSASPELAPGPTFSNPERNSRADYFRGRKTQALVDEGRALYRRGENYSAIARALGITHDTARRWLDPDYDAKRRNYAIQPAASAETAMADAPALPTLPFVPGIIISGRYRMTPQKA